MSTGDQASRLQNAYPHWGAASGIMTVIADWPYVPPQSEVQSMIDCTREPYVTFVLCTPTSIMPAERVSTQSADAYAVSNLD